MHLATLLASATILASSALAVPWHGREYSDDCYCMSDSDAQQAADIFQELIQNYSDELALDALSRDFTDYSSSVAIIINGGDNGKKSMDGTIYCDMGPHMRSTSHLFKTHADPSTYQSLDPLDITQPVFTGRHNFMAGQGSQPEIPFKQLAVFHGCDSVSMRWLTKRSGKGQETEAARIVSIPSHIVE